MTKGIVFFRKAIQTTNLDYKNISKNFGKSKNIESWEIASDELTSRS